MRPQQIIDVVTDLNEKLLTKYPDEYHLFLYTTTGYHDAVSFGEEVLWDSENHSLDYCTYDDETDEETKHEYTIKEYILKQFKEYQKIIKKIKL